MKKSKRTTANKYAVTPVKRSHLVSNSGVGSLVRLRNGATALIAGLVTWEETISLPVAPSEHEHRANREKFLRQYLIRDPELESATGVPRFHQPPRAPSDSENAWDEWQIPAIVFPRSATCESFRCGAVRHSMLDNGYAPECTSCDPVRTGRRKRMHRMKQSPIFLVCTDGHISDIDWGTELEHGETCPGADMRITGTTSVHSPKIECKSCGKNQKLESSRACNGARPWIPNAANEPCTQKMHVVDRTSVQVYFAQTKSSIHVPPKSGIDPDIVDWILINEDLRIIKADNPEHVAVVQRDLRAAGKDLSVESVILHLTHIANITRIRDENEEWDQLAARSHELDVFTKATKGFIVPNSRFLEFHETDLSTLTSGLLGPSGLIQRVVCLTRLTETRVQDGFSRFAPNSVSPIEGFQRMWGHSNREESWLPAYRAYGEGILFVFNSDKLDAWLPTSGLPFNDSDNPAQMSYRGVVAHSLAHLIMVQLSHECGYSLPSIRDRMYDLPDGRVAVLVYTAESDIMGTLGGLVEFGEGQKLDRLVDQAMTEAQWCSQDPVCINREFQSSRRQGACCHQCLFIPETSCEIMNQFLDRATLVGSLERKVIGITS